MKKFLKSVICLALCSIIVLSLVACKKDSDEKKQIKVGDYITFGKYEQDNDTSNGKEDIEWLVLDIQDNKALVISKHLIDTQPFERNLDGAFASEIMPVWENCSLRKWLNSTFLNTAFSASEIDNIITTTVSADPNPEESRLHPGRATSDKIFILSMLEAKRYFKTNADRVAFPTKYAVANGGRMYQQEYWLRTPAGSWGCIALISYKNDEPHDISNEYYESCDRKDIMVRPTMWINIES